MEIGLHHHLKFLQTTQAVTKTMVAWAFPVYPTNRSIQGSPKTPYIWDDRCTAEDAAARISEVYALGREMRNELGKTGRHWA
jgi:hypothetical protein